MTKPTDKEIEAKLQEDRAKVVEVLSSVGISVESAYKIAEANTFLTSVMLGLLESGHDMKLAMTVRDLAFRGFIVAHPAIEQEIQALTKDDEKYKKALEVLMKMALEKVMKQTFSAIAEGADAKEQETPAATTSLEVKKDSKGPEMVVIHPGPKTVQ